MKKEFILDRFLLKLTDQKQEAKKAINRLSLLRLVVFLILVAVLSLSFDGSWMVPARVIALVKLTLFVLLMKKHDTLFQQLRLREELIKQIQEDLARLRRQFQNISESLPPSLFPPQHPFAHDLDFTAENSVFKLFGGTFHRKAQRILVSWFSNENEDSIVERQQAVAELSRYAKLRRHFLAFNRINSQSDLSIESLKPWLNQRVPKGLTALFLLGIVTTILSTGSMVLRFLFGIPLPWVSFFAIQLVFFIFNAVYLKGFILSFLNAAPIIRSSGSNLLRFSKQNWKAAQLKTLKDAIGMEVKDLEQTVQNCEAIYRALLTRSNGLAYLTLNLLFQWDLIYSFRTMKWKSKSCGYMENWVPTLFSLEALSALAHFSFLFPEYIFPKLKEAHTLHFAATQLGHPCIPDKDRVCNDFQLQGNGKTILLTGSNMSGKSTFLRTVALNWVLAKAGAPCCATSLSLSTSPVWTSMRVQDSLARGTSYFYAEVKRLKRILDFVVKTDLPTFYVLDEILKGTNSRERFLASQALVAYLQEQKCSGMISTHDLELLALGRQKQFHIQNFHFAELIHSGKMSFDYKLKEGQLNSTNALRIIEAAGLPLKLNPESSL